MQFAAPIPILRIFSVEKMREFYLGFLGFTLDWEHRFGENFPLYAQVSRAGLVLHLSEHDGDATPGAAVFLPVHGIASLHAELSARDDAYAKPGLDTVDWGTQMQIRDPFGNTLRFCERPSAAAVAPGADAAADADADAASDVPGAPPLGTYRHTDGGLYRVVGMARDSRDGSHVVLYDHVWPFESGRWTRPLPEWASRFMPVTADEVAATQRGDRAADQARISAARKLRKTGKG